MLEYNLDEAEVLLQKNSDHADKNSVIVSYIITYSLLYKLFLH